MKGDDLLIHLAIGHRKNNCNLVRQFVQMDGFARECEENDLKSFMTYDHSSLFTGLTSDQAILVSQ